MSQGIDRFYIKGLCVVAIVSMFTGTPAIPLAQAGEPEQDGTAEAPEARIVKYRIVETGQDETYDNDGNEISTAEGEGLDNPQAGRPPGRTREPQLSVAEARQRADATRLRLEQISGDIQRTFNIPDSGQSRCYSNEDEIVCPEKGEAFFGQDAQYSTNPMSYTDNGDGTITDNVTGLMWEQASTLIKTDPPVLT